MLHFYFHGLANGLVHENNYFISTLLALDFFSGSANLVGRQADRQTNQRICGARTQLSASNRQLDEPISVDLFLRALSV